MPNRYIRASAIESEAVNSLGWRGEVFYRRLLNRVDDFGRYTAHHTLLRAHIFPLQLEKVSVPDIGRLLDECEGVGLLYRYESGGKPYLVMNKWEDGRAKSSDYPKPPSELIQRMQTYVYTCKHKHGRAPDPDPDPDPDYDTDAVAFARFWESYPKKVAKKQAEDSFQRQGCKGCIEDLLSAIEREKSGQQWTKEDGQYIPNPTTYLNQRRWETVVDSPQPQRQESLI